MAFSTLKLSDVLTDTMLDVLSSATAGGTFTLYSGSQPASPMAPTAQRALAVLAFDAAPPPASSTNHTWQGSAFCRSAQASGRASWGRASSARGEPLFDMPMEPLDVEAGAPCVVSPIEVKHQ